MLRGKINNSKMDIKLLNKDKTKLSFVAEGIDNVFANTLRRISLVEVPVMAVSEVNFLKNNCALYDEIIAHRLGLIPLTTDLDSYNMPEDCKCKGNGCASCQTVLTLDTKGPCTVYASDLTAKDPTIKPVYPKMPIVILLKNQGLKLEATARLGRGKEHTKFSPCHIYYKSYPDIKVEKDLKNSESVEKICPTHVFSLESGKLKIKDELACILCNACTDISDPKSSLTVNPSENNFILFLESWGQLEPKRIMQEALKIFDSKIDDCSKSLKKIK